MIPIESVTAKPFIGPVPNCNSARAAKRVVTFASSIVINADFKSPEFIKEEKRAVVTKHSMELSWLFYKLRDSFKNYIDFSTKFQFYGMLAIAAQELLDRTPDCSVDELLLHVIDQGALRYVALFESLCDDSN